MSRFEIGPGERWAFVSALAYTAVSLTLRIAAPAIDPALGSLLRLLQDQQAQQQEGSQVVHPSPPDRIALATTARRELLKL